MSKKAKALRRVVVRGFEAGYTWYGDPNKAWDKDPPENHYDNDMWGEKWYAWRRGYMMGAALLSIEEEDARDRADLAASAVRDEYDREAEAYRQARHVVNETNPQLEIF